MSIETREKSELYQIKIFLGFIATVIIVIILQQLKSIFVPFFMALLLYFLFNGVVKKMISLKVPKPLVLMFLLIFIFIVFYFLGVLIYSSVDSFVDKFPEYSKRFVGMIDGLFDQLKIPGGFQSYLDKIDWTKSIDTSSVTSILSGTFGSFAAFIGNLLLVLVFLMFMLAGRTALTGRVEKAFEEERSDKIKYIVNSIEDQVQHYLLIKIFISFSTGCLSAIILTVVGVDFAIFSALLIFILNFIPNIGSIIATMFPILISILQFGFDYHVILVAAGLMVTQFLIGNVVEPKITGKSLNLSPIVILMSLIFWGIIWGVVGMILAVPLTSAIKIVFEKIEVLKPISDLISAE
jgi:predicted PurR-regulated permease PerM